MFYYDGSIRMVEPLCYGINATSRDILIGHQLEDISQPGHFTGWKVFIVSQMVQLTVMDFESQGNRPGCDPYEEGMVQIYC